MVKSKLKTADEIFSKVDADKKAVAEQLRLLVKATVPKAAEIIRLGKVTYMLDGKDFAGIRLTKQHVDLMFFRANSLSSPHLKGQGTATDPKHLQVFASKDFDVTVAKRLLIEASESP